MLRIWNKQNFKRMKTNDFSFQGVVDIFYGTWGISLNSEHLLHPNLSPFHSMTLNLASITEPFPLAVHNQRKKELILSLTVA